MANLPLALPDVDEQQEILEETVPILERMRSLERDLLQSSLRLREYRQALITTAVTGQIDVSSEVTP